MSSSAVLSITSAGQLYFFELRPAAGSPTSAVHSIDPEIRQRLKTELDHTVQLLYRFYREDAPPEEDKLKSLGRLIYSDLLPPGIRDALKQLPLNQPLILSTNDAEFPWEVTYDGQQYLGMRWPVGREIKLPSGQQPRQNTPPPRHSWKVLFIGNPTGDLPATDEELEALQDLIERHIPQADVYLLGVHRATKQAVRMALASGEYRLIHYSGHAAFKKDNPNHSGLVLANGETLIAREIQDCLDGQPWVFLNACASVQEAATEAGAPAYAGAEALGLASAFILGGARAVIGTLWPVPDRGASAFALAIYKDLLRGKTAGGALQTARDAFWHDQPHDPIWAAYVLYGQPDLSLVEPKPQERLIATILTARLRGLSALQKGLPLEQVAEISDQVITNLARQLERYGGEVIRTDQAGLTAIFSTRPVESAEPRLPSDDPAERALRAAWTLRRTAQQARHTVSDLSDAPLDIALGLATGTIVLSRASSTLLGPPAEAAAWLVEQAGPGEILATEAVLHAGRGLFLSAPWSKQVSIAPPEHLKPGAILEILGPHADVPEGFLGPLVGREGELQRLTEAWTQVQRGHGQVINVVGGAGIGKSRLIYEFSQKLASESAQWFMVRCPSPEQQAATYALVSVLLRNLIGAEAGGDPQVVRQTVRDVLVQHPGIDDVDVSTSTAVLCAVLGLPAAVDDPPLPEDRQARRGQVVRSLRQLLASIMAERPLVLILDDLHKIDELSAEVLERLVEGIDQYPLLMLAVYRPEEWMPAWSDRRFATTMVLDQLSQAESATLVATHFQNLAPTEIAETVADWAGGNPLFVAEVVRTLQESGTLVRRNGTWLLTRPLTDIQIPLSVQEVIQDRVGRLSRSVRQVIEAAATLGAEFSKDLLAGMLKGIQDPTTIEDNLQTLERRDLIQYDWAKDELRFAHDLVQAAVYISISPEEQRAYHHRAAQAWLEIGPTAGSPIEPVAYHLYRSVTSITEGVDGTRYVMAGEVSPEALERAATALVTAGDYTRASFANHTARNYYEQARTIIQVLGQTLDRRWVGCFEGLGEAASRLSDFTSALDSLEYAFGMLRRGRMTPEDRRHAADLARRIGRIYATQSRMDDALGWMEEGLRTLGVVPGGPETFVDPLDQACAALLHIHTGSTHYLQGNFQTALEECRRGLALAEEALLPIAEEPALSPSKGLPTEAKTAIAEGSNLVGAILDVQGQSRQALEHYRRSYELYEAMQDRYQLARVGDNIGTALFYLGEWDEALQWDQKGLAFWREIEDRDNTAFAAINIGILEVYRGQWEEAEAHLEEARRLSKEVNNYRILALAHTNFGLLRLAQEAEEKRGEGEKGERDKGRKSRFDEGRVHLERALSLLEEHDIEDYLAETYCGLAEAAVLAGDESEALEMAHKALEAARELELRAEESIALRLLGLAHWLAGDLEATEEHLKQSLKVAEGAEIAPNEGRRVVVGFSHVRVPWNLQSEIAFEVGRTSLELGRLYGEMDREAEGLILLEQAIEIFDRLGAAPMLAKTRALCR